jgi:hypothetical protein
MESQLQAMRNDAAKFGRESVEMEMLRGDIKNLDAVSAQLVAEMERLKVDLNSAPRISVLQRAE